PAGRRELATASRDVDTTGAGAAVSARTPATAVSAADGEPAVVAAAARADAGRTRGFSAACRVSTTSGAACASSWVAAGAGASAAGRACGRLPARGLGASAAGCAVAAAGGAWPDNAAIASGRTAGATGGLPAKSVNPSGVTTPSGVAMISPSGPNLMISPKGIGSGWVPRPRSVASPEGAGKPVASWLATSLTGGGRPAPPSDSVAGSALRAGAAVWMPATAADVAAGAGGVPVVAFDVLTAGAAASAG